MKSIVRRIILLVILITLISTIVYATDTTKITITSDKEKYDGGETIELVVGIKDISLENGIKTVIAKIEYDKDLYESVQITNKENWSNVFYEETGKIVLQKTQNAKEDQEIFTIKLKIKEGINNVDTIKLTEINVADTKTDLWPSDVSCKIQIGKLNTSSGSGGGTVSKPEESVIEPEPIVEPEPTEWVNPFKDVNEEDWYYESVKFVNEKGLFKGIAEDEFGANVSMTRGMLIEVIYRLSGEKEEENAIFEDVDNNMYYAKAIAWASKNGITNGIGDNKFAPEREAKREEIVAILHRYAEYIKRDATAEKYEILKYDDYYQISDYAIDSFEWAVENGIIKGKDENTLAPRSITTRAQIATIIERFCK